MKTLTVMQGLDEALDEESRASEAISDATLVARALEGDRAAFELLIQKHQASLFRRARWMGLDADTASDMVQDAFVKAYTNLGSCREANSFGYWVGRILRNRVLDFLKRADRRSVPVSLSLTSDRGNPELEEARSRLRNLLQDALAALPDEQREAFLMKHGEGCSYEEMAKLANTSVSAMKMRVYRAREALQAHLRVLGSDLEM